jgi:Glycosyl transferase family 2
MSYKRVSLLLPTRKRPEYLKTFMDSYYATASGDGDSEIVFRVDFDDAESLQALAKYDWPVIVGPRRQGYRSLPGFYNEMARLATGDILICCNDDVIIETPGWAKLIIDAANKYPDGIFNIGVSTVRLEENYVFSCVSRKLVDRLGFINDERLVYSDIFLMDVAKHFGRLSKLWSVTFRHNWAGENPGGLDATRADAQRVEAEVVFADATGAWSDQYRSLHDGVVAEAIARVDPENEILAGQALLDFEAYLPPSQQAGPWPPAVPPLPWAAPSGGAGIHYHRDETFELFKMIAKKQLPRQRALLTALDNGLPALLWGQLYEHVVSLQEADEHPPIQDGKYRIEFGAVWNAPFMHGLLQRIGEVDALILDSKDYARLISPYFTLRRAMPRPSLIVIIGTGIQTDQSRSIQPRRFVDDLAAGRLDGTPHRFTHIEHPHGNGISYEILE